MESDELLRLLRLSVRDSIGHEEEAAVSFSGGVDSSLVAHLASEVSRVRCYTSAVRGSYDAEHAKETAEDLGVGFVMVHIDPASLGQACVMAAKAMDTLDPVRIAYTLPTLLVVKRCEERLVLAGNLADELFGGYAKYSRQDDPAQAMKDDLRRALEEAAAIASFSTRQHKSIAFPFASEDIVSFSSGLPISDKVAEGERKIVLREAARRAGVRTHDKPKRAAQYSSGVLREMKRLAKKDGLSLSEWVNMAVSGAVEGTRN